MGKENNAHPHTIKKFELVEGYVKSWIHKLMNNPNCKEVVFIDCMCNSGIYKDNDGERVEGTPIRVARVIADAMSRYTNKTTTLYFNDSDPEKIAKLQDHLPPDTKNFHIVLSCEDGNQLLKELQPSLLKRSGLHYLLFYDPYTATINWEALASYFFGWGEVIINHMVSDTLRAITSAKRPETIDKYEQTYLTSIKELVDLRGDKNAYDKLIKNIIERLGNLTKREYYLAAFPFFIRTNAQIYSIIFFTKNDEGFKLFKKTAWKTFGGKSSNQNTRGRENQLSLFATPPEDKQCYNVSDIADYIVDNFKERKTVLFKEIWSFVDRHPVFPTAGYQKDIEADLKHRYNCKIHGRKKEERTIDFA